MNITYILPQSTIAWKIHHITLIMKTMTFIKLQHILTDTAYTHELRSRKTQINKNRNIQKLINPGTKLTTKH